MKQSLKINKPIQHVNMIILAMAFIFALVITVSPVAASQDNATTESAKGAG